MVHRAERTNRTVRQCAGVPCESGAAIPRAQRVQAVLACMVAFCFASIIQLDPSADFMGIFDLGVIERGLRIGMSGNELHIGDARAGSQTIAQQRPPGIVRGKCKPHRPAGLLDHAVDPIARQRLVFVPGEIYYFLLYR